MRNFRRLPPLLRVATIVGLLLLLTGLGLTITNIVTGLYESRVTSIALNLFWLGMACSLPVMSYSRHFRRSDRGDPGPLPLDSWQSQVRAILLLSAPPLFALALALVIPSSSGAFVFVSFITAFAGFMSLAGFAIVFGVGTSGGPMCTPPTG